MKKIYSGILLFSIIVVSISCHKEDPILPSSTDQSDYYPLSIGHYAIFDVDSIRFFDVTLTSDTARYQIMELIDSSFTDNSGRLAYRINRQKRKNSSGPWETTDLWTTIVTSTTAEKVEENLRFIKLLFPVAEGKTWDGNAYINTTGDLSWLANWKYAYRNVNAHKDINNFSFDSTVTVTEDSSVNLIQNDFEQEIYAAGVGLVYKISRHVSKQDVSKSWDHPEKGYIIQMKLRDYR